MIVDDQISSGKTFDLKKNYSNALSVEIATLIIKSSYNKRMDDIKYYFFLSNRGNNRVVGFGMDYREKHMELQYISSVKKEDLIK